MAGIDKEIEGEAIPQKGIKIGYLAQEPQLDPNKTVRGNVEEAVAEIKRIFGRSLKLRSVSAGGCNGCELEIHALNNPYYNLEGLGIDYLIAIGGDVGVHARVTAAHRASAPPRAR